MYLGIDSLAMNVRPFDEINQFRTRCFISFASHQKRNLSLTQVLKLYVAAYQVGCRFCCCCCCWGEHIHTLMYTET